MALALSGLLGCSVSSRCMRGDQNACTTISNDWHTSSPACVKHMVDMGGICGGGGGQKACHFVQLYCSRNGDDQACEAGISSAKRAEVFMEIAVVLNALNGAVPPPQPKPVAVRIPGPNQAAVVAQRQQWCAQAQETGNINSWQGMHVCGGWPPK